MLGSASRTTRLTARDAASDGETAMTLLSVNRAVADVMAVAHARPMDCAGEPIGDLLRIGHRIAQPHGAQHAAAVGEYICS